MAWLGLALSEEEIHDMVWGMDSDGDGLLTLDDFKLAFYREGDEQRADEAGMRAPGPEPEGPIVIPQVVLVIWHCVLLLLLTA